MGRNTREYNRTYAIEYRQKEAGKARDRRYRTSDLGKAAAKRYDQSEKGKERYRRRYQRRKLATTEGNNDSLHTD